MQKEPVIFLATRTSQLGTQKSFDIQKESLNIAELRCSHRATSDKQ